MRKFATLFAAFALLALLVMPAFAGAHPTPGIKVPGSKTITMTATMPPVGTSVYTSSRTGQLLTYQSGPYVPAGDLGWYAGDGAYRFPLMDPMPDPTVWRYCFFYADGTYLIADFVFGGTGWVTVGQGTWTAT